MRVTDQTIHQRKVFAYLSEKEIFELIAKKVAKESKFEIGQNTSVKVIISEKDRAGTSGFEHYAEVTLVNEIVPPKPSLPENKQ